MQIPKKLKEIIPIITAYVGFRKGFLKVDLKFYYDGYQVRVWHGEQCVVVVPKVFILALVAVIENLCGDFDMEAEILRVFDDACFIDERGWSQELDALYGQLYWRLKDYHCGDLPSDRRARTSDLIKTKQATARQAATAMDLVRNGPRLQVT